MPYKKSLILLPAILFLISGGALLLLSFKTNSQNNYLISLHQQQVLFNLHTKSFIEIIKDNLKSKKIIFHNHKGNFEYNLNNFNYKAVIFELPNPYGVDLFFVDIFAILHYKSQDFSNDLHFFITLQKQ